MSVEIALAVTGLACEPEVISRAREHGVTVVRRCVDAADLLGAALAAPGLVCVLTAGLPRISPDILSRIDHGGSPVIGLALTPADAEGFARLGIEAIVDCVNSESDAGSVLDGILAALHTASPRRGVWSVESGSESVQIPERRGRLIAVWGPPGSPGRSTTTVVLARALSGAMRTAMVDADLFAPSLALQCALREDPGGLLAACRHAESGSLSSRSLLASMSRITDRLHLLSGLGDARRWSQVRPAAFTRVLEQVRADMEAVVVDVGPHVDADPASALSRSAIALTALQSADVIVAVCQATPLGTARFLAELPDLASLGTPVVCVITGGNQRDEARRLIREAGIRCGSTITITDLVAEGHRLAAAVRRGRLPGEGRGSVRLSRPAAKLAELVA